ncbi:MAG: methylated-DNA--[protein]-cysteine S-methyltransferase [Ignavibacteriae bacterium]|nr:methylated-DNA--[protein]-cysteine S-methyltransferase [Ignavibacteriota bacterium]
MQTIYYISHKFDVGTLHIASTDNGVFRIDLPKRTKAEFVASLKRHSNGAEIVESAAKHKQIIDELEEYFAGKLERFRSKLDLRGTDFQLQVWNELLNIPYGTVISYKQLAQRVGKPDGYQAVGRVNGANPIPIVIPCHRVIGSNNDLVGYGGGIKMKEFLLKLEGALML